MARILLLLLAAGILGGCANKERIVLLPGPDGKVGKVVVDSRSGQTTLSTAFAAVDVSGQRAEAKTLGEAEVRQRYQAALDAMPQRPVSFTLQFLFDKAQLVPEARATITAVAEEFSRRSVGEVLVIGHTDQAGESQYNMELSRRRAEAVREMLLRVGIPKESIEIQWRGDREPVSTTGKQDQRNRRVEVKVR
ncbi:MAG TPA: OmpA family protein [Rhodocyclaceae bacterium]|nr:OmpA family protein [Rhodocyclaceae bacterium]